MPEKETPQARGAAAGVFGRDGLARFLLWTAARAYLSFLLALTAIAVLPLALGWHGSVIQSGSMEPNIRPGDLALSAPLPESAPVPVGGVLEFRAPYGPEGTVMTVMHRVVRDNGDGTYTTRGDANRSQDSWRLTRDQITGQGRLLVRFVGLPGYWLGHRDYAPLALWASGTALAVAASALGPDSAGRERPSGRRRMRRPGATAASLLAMALAAAGAGAHTGRETQAAFTGTTESSASWTTAVLPPLTPGQASPFVLLAATGIANSGAPGQVSVTGSVGTSAGTVTGFTGHLVPTDPTTASNALTDARALYTAAVTRPSPRPLPSALTGTLAPGIYDSSGAAVTVAGALVLDAGGDASAVFVLRAPSITTGAGSTVVLANGASASNVHWAASSSITLGASSTAGGNFLSQGPVRLQPGVTLTGRAISLSADVALAGGTFSTPR